MNKGDKVKSIKGIGVICDVYETKNHIVYYCVILDNPGSPKQWCFENEIELMIDESERRG